MTKIQFSKEQLSVKIIGKLRFWIGIFSGFFSAISISLAFNYFREIFRYFTGISSDLLILEANELLFFNYFFASLSTVLGLSMTAWIWMGNTTNKRKKDRIFKRLSITNTLLIFWVMILVVARFGSILPLLLFGIPGYDNEMNLFEEFWILFVLIPIVIFMQSWFTVRLVYRTGHWILFSVFICILTAFILEKTTSVEQEIHYSKTE